MVRNIGKTCNLTDTNVSLINVAQTFQFAKMCHKLKVCATIHASLIRKFDLSNSRYTRMEGYKVRTWQTIVLKFVISTEIGRINKHVRE